METKLIYILPVIIFSLLILVIAAIGDNVTNYYKFDDASGVWTDEIGTKHFTNVGANYGTAGIIGDSCNLDVDGDYIYSDPQDIGSGDFSVSLWIKWDEASGDALAQRLFSSSAQIESYIQPSTNQVYIFGSEPATLSATAITDGAWTHLVITYDGTNVRFYVNGSLDDNFPTAATTQGSDLGATMYFGRYFGSNVRHYTGLVDEAGWWSRVLDQEEVTALYNDGDGLAYPFLPVDTCTCPGAGENWEIDMSDYCNITEACNLTTGMLNFTGAGATRCNATITTTNLGDPGSEGILYIQDDCLIYIKG